MKLDRNSLIAGLPAIKVRDVLRCLGGYSMWLLPPGLHGARSAPGRSPSGMLVYLETQRLPPQTKPFAQQ